MQKFPNFFIVGAPKCGTTSLANYLNQHPDIFFPEKKEIHFFDVNREKGSRSMFWVNSKKDYLKLYESIVHETIIGDATSSYLSDPETPKLLYKYVPDAKILISLRNPITRTFSQYLHRIRQGYENRSFREVILKDSENLKNKIIKDNILFYSFYSDSIKNYLNQFGSSNVKIIIFESWINDIKTLLSEIELFLGVQSFDNYKISLENPYTNKSDRIINFSDKPIVRKNIQKIIPRTFLKKFLKTYSDNIMYKPKITLQEKGFLKTLFIKDVQNLEKILEIKLPWKLK